jgi:hypothetical protein
MKHMSLAAVMLGGVLWTVCLATETTPLGEPKEHWCTFLDALHEPIPQAKVKIYRRNKHDEQVLVTQTSLDKWGNMAREPANSQKCTFVLSHPEYGLAEAKRYYIDGDRDNLVYFVPLVRRGTEAYKRSMSGVVVDPTGERVPGAKIHCGLVMAPGEAAIDSIAARLTALTDEQGRFAMYLPAKLDAAVDLIPLGSKYYEVKIDPPAGHGLILYSGSIPNGQDSTIVLDRAEHFRTFIFEDTNGPVSDLEKLKVIRLCVRLRETEPWYIQYPDWRHGRTLPLGTFEAEMYAERELPFEKCEFGPIEVTADSPEELVFKAKEKPADKDILYTGQVVHGTTDEPLPGVFVAASCYTTNHESGCGVRSRQQALVHP